MEKKLQPSLKKLYENFFGDQAKVEAKPANKEMREATERFTKYGNQMKQIFGGKLADYKEFIMENKLNIYDLVIKYCILKEIPKEEG